MAGPDTSAAPPAAPAGNSRKLLDSRRLHALGWTGLVCFIAWQVYRTQLTDTVLITLGCAISILAALPALRWAKRAEGHVPAFELMILTAIPFYAMPLFRQHTAAYAFDPEIMGQAAFGVIVFLGVASFVHRVTRVRPLRNRLWTDPVFPPGKKNRLPLIGMFLNVAFLYVQDFTDLIPSNLVGPLRALFFGVGIASTFIATSMWGRGELSSGDRVLVGVGLALQFVFNASGLYLISASSLLLLGAIGYVIERRRIPYLVIGGGFLFIALLHSGKDEMRRLYWNENPVEHKLTDLPGLFVEWIGHGVESSKKSEESMSKGLLERTSLFHVMCVIMDRTPSLVPHLQGETYESIPLILIPRFVWRNKPSPHESNRTLAVAYAFASEESSRQVSIAFGIPAEAYANFGFLGIVLVGAFCGWFFRTVAGWSQGAPTLSLAGLSSILLVAWSFQAEMTLAVWLSSLAQAMIALVLAPLAIKRFIAS